MAGLIGKKVGMTRIFDDNGIVIPVTVIEAGPCPVTQIKTEETDGYRAVQIGFGAKKTKRTSKGELGHAGKVGLETAPVVLKEIPMSEEDEYELGQEITVDVFEAGDRVKIAGRTKGRGFQGVMRRHGFHGRPGTHGHPASRTPGSMGPGTDPSRVIKGKKLPGRMGGTPRTALNKWVVKVDPERNLLFIKGGVPGARNSYLLITK